MLRFYQLNKLVTALPLAAFTFFLSGLPVLANLIPPDDTKFQEQVRNNTVCSFIQADQPGRSGVNVRKGPGQQYQVVTQLNRGDGVRAVRRKGDWVEIAARVRGEVPNERFIPLRGWVNNQYINGCSEDKFEMWRQPQR